MSQAKKTSAGGVPAAKKAAGVGKFRLRMKSRRAIDLKRQAMGKTSCKLRKSISPGTVLILLSGGFRGKRAICLKQLEPSGLLLVTGPFTINGVPLRRVNSRYVIATSTKVDVSSVDLTGVTDKIFTRSTKEKQEERRRRTKDDTSMFAQQDMQTDKALPDSRKKLQDQVDKTLLSSINSNKILKQYLTTRFCLRSNMAPHAMKF